MTALRHFLTRHGRRLLLPAAGGVVFGLWLGLWLRLAPASPRTVIHGEGFAFICFAEDGKSIYGGSEPKQLGAKPQFRRWDTETGKLLDLGADPEDLMFVNRGGERQMFNLRSHPRLASTLRASRAIGSSIGFFQHAADRMLLKHQDEGADRIRVTLWDLAADQEIPMQCSEYPIALSADGSRLATAPAKGPTPVVIWNARDGTRLAEFDPGPKADPRWMRLSPNGQHLAISAGYSSVHIWTLTPPRRVAELDGLGIPVFSSDWSYRIAGGQETKESDYIVRVVELDSGVQVAELTPYPPSDRTRGVVFPTFVSASDWLLISYWSQSWWQSLAGRGSTSDESYVATVRLFQRGTWREAPRIEQAGGWISGWSPDGSMLVMSVPSEQKIVIYDLPPRRPLFLLLTLAALPTLLFTALLWWRFGR